MGFLLSGFSPSQNVRLQNAVIGSNHAIEAAYKEMTTVRRTGQASKSYRRWFGNSDRARIDQVWRVLNMMQYATGASFIRYNRGFGTAYGVAYEPASGWTEKSVKQILDQGEFEMGIENAFYRADTPVSETVQTIAHELSHLVGNTDDVDCPWDLTETCYGRANCRRLAERHPDLAVRNADNYGYYVLDASAPPGSASTDKDLGLTSLFH